MRNQLHLHFGRRFRENAPAEYSAVPRAMTELLARITEAERETVVAIEPKNPPE
jgi:hypothetical protein